MIYTGKYDKNDITDANLKGNVAHQAIGHAEDQTNALLKSSQTLYVRRLNSTEHFRTCNLMSSGAAYLGTRCRSPKLVSEVHSDQFISFLTLGHHNLGMLR